MAQALYWSMLDHLTSQFQGFSRKPLRSGFLRRFRKLIHAVDSTTIPLVANALGWAKHRRRKAAAKCHLRLNLQTFLPGCAIIDPARHHDSTRVHELCAALQPGEIVVFDKAYCDFEHLFHLQSRGVFWVTRAKDNMSFRRIRKRKPTHASILCDEEIQLVGFYSKSSYPEILRRITAMVEGRPDWVLSRQRAWGVPITLFVDRKSGQYLCDAGVNARIIAGVREMGVDAWSDERAQAYLGSDYALADYERVTDILDVWFDSGCTHAFVLESGRWPDLQWPADLYLEGSDQHRGWFQSSLLQSCGTRGRAPYNAVLTHGFTMDQKGMKMSKSLGNTINPLDLMRDNGADILRLWALTVDFTEDHRIGKEILAGVSDQYRKLRNTFRYLLGALDGFSDAEKVAVADMPELERYMLHLLAEMDTKLKTAVNDFDFNTYVRLLTEFCNEDLSAFFFDIRKDCLYCDAATDPKRMAYRTVLDILFHALVRYAAPVLVFTSEEVWQTRFPDADSVHFSEWPELTQIELSLSERAKWGDLRVARSLVNEHIEPLRREKVLGSSLQAEVILSIQDKTAAEVARSVDMAEICITASCHIADDTDGVIVKPTTNHKCGRCWRHLPEVVDDGALCGRCADVVGG
jgi:isoleucyl-tRNA synthetase